MVALNPCRNVDGDAAQAAASCATALGVAPLAGTPWGARSGRVRDPFGVLWLFDVGE